MQIRRAITGVVASVMALFLMASAQADKPQIFRYAFDFDFGPIAVCEDFEVWTRGWEIDTEKWWYNDSGEAVRIQFSIHVKESEYYNSTDHEKFVTQGKKGVGENFTNDIDLTTGDEHWRGAPFRLTIPGIGHVLLDTGTWFWDASEQMLIHHGPDYALADGETGLALCEALE